MEMISTPVRLLELIGNTPLLDLSALTGNPDVRLFAKAEQTNPGGSVKDRPALAMVRDAERRGYFTSGRRLLDATSGNTGIAYAMIGAALGIPVTVCLPGSASVERKRILRAYGAELRSDRSARRERRRDRRGAAAGGGGAGALGLPRSIFQSRELGRPLPHHRPRDLGTDRGLDHSFRHRSGHQRHVDGCGPFSAPGRRSAHPADLGGARLAPSTAWKG